MECPRCGTVFDGNFCPSCGAPRAEPGDLPELCARCGAAFAGTFCPECGLAAGTSPPEEAGAGRKALGALWLVAMGAFLVYLVAILVAFLWVSPAIAEGILRGDCPECQAVFFWLNPFSPQLLQVVTVGGGPFLLWFAAVIAIMVALYAFLFLWHGGRTARAMRRPLHRLGEKLGADTALVAVGQVFLALLFFDIVYLAIILPHVFQIEPSLPPGLEALPDWYILFLLVDAAIWEEIAFRVLLIGLPLALLSLPVRVTQALKRALPSGTSAGRYVAGSLAYLLGGRVDGSSPQTAQVGGAALVLVTAAFFGLAHVPAWGAWKFVDTFLAGLALGYLFLRYGIAAAILLHFAVNSLGVLVQVTEAETALLSGIGLGLLILTFVVLGSGFFLHYVRETGRLLLRPFRSTTRRVEARRATPPRRSSPREEDLSFPVSCPACGGREARYEEGRLTCAACGRHL